MTTHTHHLKPKWMGGTDDPSNLLKVTVEEHALIHEARYIAYGHWQDKVAWLALSKQIGGEEARLMAIRAAAGTDERREACRQGALKRLKEGRHNFTGLNEKRLAEGTHNFLDGEKNRQTQLDRVKNGTHHFLSGEVQKRYNKMRLENGTSHLLVQVTCPHCGKTGQKTTMARWHFDRCKKHDRLQIKSM